jgi:2-polyprenyl-3-methyl-5-hydroxy-6-metoxy-1,4-benzoquinol methylase
MDDEPGVASNPEALGTAMPLPAESPSAAERGETRAVRRRAGASPGSDPIRRVIGSYDSLAIRLYCRGRFTILREIFLEEIGQYLPPAGQVLDLGCGFGFFSLYFAAREPGRRMLGVDLNARRIAEGREAARRMGLDNIRYEAADAARWDTDERFDAIYLLDLVHHLPVEEVPGFLRKLREKLVDGGVLLLKEVEDRPAWKRWFTLWLDRAVVGLREPIRYWPATELGGMLEGLGFDVKTHRMRDWLPYPHILYVCRLPGPGEARTAPSDRSS